MSENVGINLPGAVFIGVFEFAGVLAEDLLALLAGEDDLGRLEDLVVLSLRVALRTVKPLLAALGANLNLSIQNVFAHDFFSFSFSKIQI